MGHAYDPGLAVEVIDTEYDPDIQTACTRIEETIAPIVLWRGQVVRTRQVIICPRAEADLGNRQYAKSTDSESILGRTNSAVVRSNGVEARVYQSNDLMNVTPSAVRVMKNGRLIVGKRAQNAIDSDPENVATEFKRNMGKKAHSFSSLRPQHVARGIVR